MKRILSIDGGGALGIIPLTVLKNIEKQLNKPIYEVFDLIVGTSVGAIIGGVLSSGKLTCKDFHKKMIEDLPVIFKRRLRFPIFQPKYDRRNVEKSITSKIGDLNMISCKTKFMCTSINYVDGSPHFFKSWEEKDGKMKLTEALLRSSAAPLYFGKIVDEKEKAVWIDGGCGNLNDPAMQGYIEALRQDWLPEERVHLLSIGCGQTFQGIPFDKCRKFKNIKEVSFYLDINDGGLARAQISMVQDNWLKSFSKEFSKFTAQRVQYYNFPKKLNKLDNVKNMSEFIKFGEEMSKDVNYTYLR
jgi:uncharacterized protein